MAWVPAVVWVQPLAQELPHAVVGEGGKAMVNIDTCSRDVHWDETFKISHWAHSGMDKQMEVYAYMEFMQKPPQ